MYNRISSCDRIVIVNNYETFRRQEIHQEGKGKLTVPDDAPIFCDMFDKFLGTISTQDCNNYDKVINIKFSYTSTEHLLKSVCPDFHFNLPSDLERFFKHFHAFPAGYSEVPIDWTKVDFEKLVNWKDSETLKSLTKEISALTSNVPVDPSSDSLDAQTTEMTSLIDSPSVLNSPSTSSVVCVDIPMDDII